MFGNSQIGASGTLSLKVLRGLPLRPLRIVEMLRLALPWFGNGREVNLWRLRNLPNFWRGFWRLGIARLFNIAQVYGQLHLRVLRSNGDTVDLGLAGLRMVTTVGANFLASAFQGTATLSNLKYHGFGSGAGVEDVTNTTLSTEFTTQYAVNNTRPTGSQGAGGTAQVYRTIATFTPDAAAAVTEHGLFDQASNAGGTLFDKTLFPVVNLNGTGDALQATYDCAITPGG